MLQESDLIPYHLSRPPGERILILAPHPDDETLGCGGTIRLLVESKKHVKVVFLTSGEKADPSNKLSKIVHNENPPIPPIIPPHPPLEKGGRGDLKEGYEGASHITEYSLLREKEAKKALGVLGVSEYEFFRFPDRELYVCYTSVFEKLLKVVDMYLPDTIYSPSMVELNPDHRTAASLSMEIQKVRMQYFASVKNMPPIRIVFYEITTPLRPNILVDITSVYKRKKRAIKKYKSQLRLIDYLRHITALNAIRTLTVSGSCYVEAFWCVDSPLRCEDVLKWLSYQEKLKA